MDGMVEIAEQAFDMPVRRGMPMNIGGLADVVSSPAFSTGIGLVLYGKRFGAARRKTLPSSIFSKIFRKFQETFTELF